MSSSKYDKAQQLEHEHCVWFIDEVQTHNAQCKANHNGQKNMVQQNTTKTKHNLKQQNRKYPAGLTDELSPICKARRPRTGLPNVVLPTCHQATPYARHILYQYNIMISKNKDAT